MEFKRGTTFDFAGALTDDVTGQPIDISGWQVEAKIRKEVGGRADTLIADLIGTVEDGPNGLWRVRAATAEETEAWPLGYAVWDIVFITTAGARVPTVGFFPIKIIDPATREDSP